MASIFGHAIVAISLGHSFSKKIKKKKFWLLAILCAIIPDADVIGFSFHIKYGSFWGHRGFSHSILFAFLLGFLITFLFYKQHFFKLQGILLSLFFAVCTISHGVLDALTTGGLGVAFFSPFNDARYFFPWRPIQVSPIGAANFFGEKGVRVLKSEFLWIGIPSFLYIIVCFFLAKIKNNKKYHEE